MEEPKPYGFFGTILAFYFSVCYDISGDMMFENMDNLKLLSIYEGTSIPIGTYPGRPYHMFIFKVSGASIYRFPDGHETLNLPEGSMLFLPSGTAYTAIKNCADESRYILLRFEAALSQVEPCVFSLSQSSDMQIFFRSMVRRWLFGDPSRRHLCYAMFYELLASITSQRNPDYGSFHQKERISTGIAYLEQHIFDSSLTVAQIAACAGVSETYFRRIFQAVYNQSPKQYIQSKRLSQAQAILESGHFTSIQSVAAMVGYEDPLYFSRAFKRKYGTAPSESF